MSTIERALSRKKRKQQDETSDENDAGGPPATGRESGTHPAAPRRDIIGVDFEPRGPLLKLDLIELRRQSMYPSQAMEDRLSNEYRRIKRPLVGNAIGRGVMQVDRGNLIMVTSAIEGEGKTFTALNLALSIARDPDFSVTLVDGDVARAS